MSDDSYSLQEMLTYAIQDEYLAQAEYAAIMKQFGTVKPFSNIIKSEGTHINLLLSLFKANNITVPANDATSKVVIPATLTDTYQAGITAEKNNIAMYDKFLKENLPSDVILVFQRLKIASQNHLAAFEQAAKNAGQFNPGRGRYSSIKGRGYRRS